MKSFPPPVGTNYPSCPSSFGLLLLPVSPTAATPNLNSYLPVAVVLALLLCRASFVLGKRLVTRYRSGKPMSLTVKWGRERLYVPFPTPETKLAVVRDAVAELTSLPRDSFKLIHGGAVMKDDNAPISAFSLRPGSVIAVIGGNTGPLGPSKDRHSTKERPTEESVVGQIQAELSKVRNTIVPLLDTFLVNVGPSSAPTSSSAPSVSKTQSSTSQSTKSTATSSTSTSPPTPSDLEQDHARLGELLLQCLLRLDLINMDGEWVEARKERKLAIKEVQSWLDKLDDAWKSRTLA